APAVGAVAALVLLAAFSAVLARAVASGIGAPCACFGRPRTDPVSVIDIVRNILLSLLAVVALGAGRPTRPSPGEAAVVVAAVVGGTLLLAVLRWVHAARHSSGW
ncbi:MAG: Methylamine utilization protein MauE, partial [Actinomycetota bacterium]|nr:Methylamine utilization protein MauE [Actinomycetota bacterium]